MQKKKDNLFITLLFYYFSMVLSGFFSCISCHKTSTHPTTLNPKSEKEPTLPDMISDHSSNIPVTILNRKSEKEPTLPDMMSSHMNSGNNREKAIPKETPSIESTFGEVYHLAYNILHPIIKPTKVLIGLHAIIASEEECLIFEKELKEKLEEALKECPGLIRLKEKIEKDLEEEWKAILEQYPNLLMLTKELGNKAFKGDPFCLSNYQPSELKRYKELEAIAVNQPKYFVSLIQKHADQAEKISNISEQEVTATLHAAQEAAQQKVDNTSTGYDSTKALDGTLEVVRYEKSKINFSKYKFDNLLAEFQAMVIYKDNFFVLITKEVKNLQDAIATCEFTTTNVGVSHLKTIIQGQEVTGRNVVMVATKSAETVLGYVKKEVQRLQEAITRLKEIKKEITHEVEKLQEAITRLEEIEKEIIKEVQNLITVYN